LRVNDTSRVVRTTIVSDATTWSITYDHHSDDSRGVIYGHIFFFKFSGLYYKQVTIIIYDRNHNGQYYKTTITIVIDDLQLRS
jgi:hypothetical protein